MISFVEGVISYLGAVKSLCLEKRSVSFVLQSAPLITKANDEQMRIWSEFCFHSCHFDYHSSKFSAATTSSKSNQLNVFERSTCCNSVLIQNIHWLQIAFSEVVRSLLVKCLRRRGGRYVLAENNFARRNLENLPICHKDSNSIELCIFRIILDVRMSCQ